MNKTITKIGILGLLCLFMMVIPSSACPDHFDAGNRSVSYIVSAGIQINENTATYTFSSVNRNPADGVLGLIEYCIYTSPLPDSIVVIYPGWEIGTKTDWFSYNRPDGNLGNIPLDGTKNIIMGSVTWNSDIPEIQNILLHINDAQECDKLYGGNPGTCWVIPSIEAEPPTVSKDATPAFSRTFTWEIIKDVDKTIVTKENGFATFNYTIGVSHNAGTDEGYRVNGIITVFNPNNDPVTGIDLNDTVDNNGVCSIVDGTGITVPGKSSITREYSCEYSSLPAPNNGINTVIMSWDEQILSPGGEHLTGGSSSATAVFDFATTVPELIDDNVEVSDSFDGDLGIVNINGLNPTIFTYSRIIDIPQSGCISYDNIASFVTDDTQTSGSDSQTVTVCRIPARTGALTMGFWQNKNGQAIIKNYGNGLAMYLRTYHPFSDLPTGSSGAQTAQYVYTIIKSANAGGSSMNAMLKAQMLATALDVYFSDPALGGNRINALAPIGNVVIDLTQICKDNACMITEDVSSAFGGATSMSINGILTYQNISDPLFDAGAVWYNNVKSIQELAKDTFDAINNNNIFV